jgi:cytochrome c oxidase cbb3-type subunit III
VADFVSDFWSYFVGGATLLSLLFCAFVLVANSRVKVKAGDAQTTGHVWDEDLGEYNNPLPRWWMWLFWITLVFAVVYLVLYPGLGANAGVLGWSSRGEHQAEVARAEKQFAPLFDKYLAMPVEAVAKDADALAMGERLFLNYCSQCHGSDARGGLGFPNLTDNDWLYGGDARAIKTSILDGRNGVMPPLGAAVGGQVGANELANYVLSLSGATHDAALAAKGREKFAVCAACHGPEGKGMAAVGAPNLTDKIWLHGSTREAIVETIIKGRNNAMPPHKDIVGEGKAHVLAAYVYGLANKGK